MTDTAALLTEPSTTALPSQVLPELKDIIKAAARMKDVVRRTPLQLSQYLSQRYNANILLKREDLQPVRSFKLRGAYNRIVQLTAAERARGIVCASAGNHSQGVAYSCQALGIKGTVFMPANSPQLKINKVRQFGGNKIDVVLVGNTFDEACQAAVEFQRNTGACFIHPFDDAEVISGQGTLALEILQDAPASVDLVLTPVGGGGLAAGIGTVFQARSPKTRVIGVEPEHAAALQNSLAHGANQSLASIDPFVDGASTLRVGELGYVICSRTLDSVVAVPDRLTCQALIDLYQEQAIVAELSGSLGIAALELLKEEIEGKTVVCILSGGNNDFSRFGEILQRANTSTSTTNTDYPEESAA
ncbi:threonine ammonia-lyase IlvA [Oceanobacter mangrovi]|uniref:threonine ammonia-lyase IlvA n=1 Tax=Oceanobacter mangrovi TaxID=2862510 RepID=UPI001C8E9F2D|nr:threonine ammonia-lyase IlvA [Oceanobacter mangrovi]